MNKQSMTMLDAAAIERSVRSGQKKSRNYGRMFTGLLFLLFVITLLLAMMAGTGVYKTLQSVQDESNDLRISSSLLANKIHANDAIDSVAVGKGPEGKSLVLLENTDNGSYELRIYLYQGSVVEEYSVSGSPYSPARASEVIASSQTFDFTYHDGLLTVITDQGTSNVALRSVREGV